MIKKLLISVLFVVVLVVGAAFFYIDSIVKNGIEVVGSDVLGTAVTVESVSISPLSGSGSIRGLVIENPEGFSADNIMQLGEVRVALDIASLTSDVIEITEVSVIEPVITFETKITTDNMRALMENLPASTESEPSSSDEAAGKGLIIKEFNLNAAQVNIVASIIEQSLVLSDIQLTDIGTENQAATVSQVLELVLGSLSKAILTAEKPGLNELRESVEGRLQEGVEQVEEGVEEIGNKLRNILN